MTREEAALILHPDTTVSALDNADNNNDKTRIELVEEACRMGAEALRQPQSDAETVLIGIDLSSGVDMTNITDIRGRRTIDAIN